MLETLYLAEDVYTQAEIDEAMEETDLKAQELDLARQIVEGLQADFDPSELTSGYRRDLRELLEAKLKGEPIVVPEPEAEPAPTVDLIEALKASVAAAKTSSPARKAAADKRTDRKPARKSTASKR